MKIAPFSVEEYFARYEFEVAHNLCASDCETMSVAELLQMAGVEMDDFGRLELGYTESQGHPELRTAIAATYGDDVDAGDVIVLAAPEEGIYLTMRALLEPDDEVVVLGPAYNSLRNVPEHICGEERVKQWEITPAGDGWTLDLDQLETLLSPRTKLLIINFPHNPTGYLPSRPDFEAIVDAARRRGVWLFCDEMYRGLEVDDAARLPSAAGLYERSVVLAGLSKAHGLPGLRAGWLVIQDAELRGRLINWKHYTSICAPAPSEFLALAGLAAHNKLTARNRRLIEQNLAAADDFFAAWPQTFTWRRPQAGSVALVGVNVPSATDYCHRLAEEAGILLLPGPYLGYDDSHVRFGFGRADFVANLRAYEAHLHREGAP